MRKNFLMTFVLLVGLLFGVQPNAHADYPPHLNGDPDFIITDGHMGTGWYMRKSSLNVEQYTPPIYVISVSVYAVSDADRGGTNYHDVRTFRFRYDWDSCAMYIQDNNRNWRYLKPLGSWAETGVSMPTGEMAFYIAYGKRFYGRQKWYHDSLKDYYNAFSDDFYRRAR